MEVLGIIVVLGIISVITVPAVLKIVDNSKKNAFKEHVEGIVRSASTYYAEKEDELGRSFKENGGLITFYFDQATGLDGSTKDKKYKIKFTGKLPESGMLILYNNGDIEVENITNGRFYANKDADTIVAVTDTSTTLSREELSKAVKELQATVKSQQTIITNLQTKNTDQDSKISTNASGITTNKSNITTITTTANTNKSDIGTLKTNVTTLQNSMKNIDVLNKTYPVGSIYISTTGTSPSVLFGGVWVAYGTGRTLVGINTGDGNFNTIGKTGGSNTNTLTVANLPSHTHSIPALSGSTNTAGEHGHGMANIGFGESSPTVRYTVGWGYVRTSSNDLSTTANGNHTHSLTTNASTTGSTGGTSAINNLQPYITVYMWKRTA